MASTILNSMSAAPTAALQTSFVVQIMLLRAAISMAAPPDSVDP